MYDVASLAALTSKLREERGALLAQIERAKQERDALTTAPLPKTEVIAKLDRLIDSSLLRFDENLERALERVQHRPTLDYNSLEGGFPFLMLMNGKATLDQELIVGLLGTALRERCRAVVGRMSWPNAGPTMQERTRLRARLDEQIADCEERLAAMDSGLAAAGISP